MNIYLHLARYKLPIWDPGPISSAGIFLDVTIRQALNEWKQSPLEPPDWDHGRNAQDTVFGLLGSPNHAFNSEQHAWIKLSEPQITKGWNYFLNDSHISPDALHLRRLAFLESLLSADDALPLPDRKDSINIQAEVSGRAGRRSRSLDLIIEWKIGDNYYALAIEFKLGHHVTPHQLSDYRQIMKNRIKNMDRVRLVVVLASHASYPISRRRSKNWRVWLWHDVLRRMERRLCDSELEFCRFRHTVWHRAGI